MLRDEGLSAREIAEQVESASHRVRLFGIVNTLEYLHKGGRLPASMAVVGTLLKVKPLITHVKPLSELADVVQMIREKKEMRIKVLLKP